MDKNPIVMMIGETEIRKENYIKVRYNHIEYARLVRISQRLNLPVSKVIALSSQPCPICDNDHIQLTIPLGLISTKKQLTGSPTKKTQK